MKKKEKNLHAATSINKNTEKRTTLFVKEMMMKTRGHEQPPLAAVQYRVPCIHVVMPKAIKRKMLTCVRNSHKKKKTTT